MADIWAPILLKLQHTNGSKQYYTSSVYLCFVTIVPATTILAAKDMSDMLNLNCWVLGDDPERVFSVKIAKSETVDALKDAIKEKKQNAFVNLDADSLDLWKVSMSS